MSERLVLPPPGPIVWLHPEFAAHEAPPPAGDDVIDLARRPRSLSALVGELPRGVRRLVVPRGPRGDVLARLVRALLRREGRDVRVERLGREGPEPLEERLVEASETVGRSVRGDPARVRRLDGIPFFATDLSHPRGPVHTRLQPGCFGLLPGDVWPDQERRRFYDLLRSLRPDRVLAFAALESLALAGADPYEEALLRRPAGGSARPGGGGGLPFLVAIDGIDGSGKSTQVARLCASLAEGGLRVRAFKIFRHGVFHDTITDVTRSCFGGRALHLWPLQRRVKALDSLKCWLDEVRPALSGLDAAVFDRFTTTHEAAGTGRFHHDAYVTEILAPLPRPDALVVLDLPVEQALARIAGRGAPTIDENPYMLGRYRERLLERAAALDGLVLDATRPPDEIAREIERFVRGRWEARARARGAKGREGPGGGDAAAAKGSRGRGRRREGRPPRTLLVDPAGDAAASALVPAGGSFGRAVRAALGAGGPAPDRVPLELYAYEILERLRARAAGEEEAAEAVWVPFDPEAALAAAGEEAHAAFELCAMLPRGLRVVRRVATPDETERAARALFGRPVFDAAAYAQALAREARETALSEVGDPVRVAGLWLERGGAVLVERRPRRARRYAGLWDTPGGVVEPGESPADAARREAVEELGIDVEDLRLLAIVDEEDPTSGAPFRHFAFAAVRWRGEPAAREGQRLSWRRAEDLVRDPDAAPSLRWWKRGLARR